MAAALTSCFARSPTEWLPLPSAASLHTQYMHETLAALFHHTPLVLGHSQACPPPPHLHPPAPQAAAPGIETRETLDLLQGITGYNEPGVLMALMGGSGAGKTVRGRWSGRGGCGRAGKARRRSFMVYGTSSCSGLLFVELPRMHDCMSCD